MPVPEPASPAQSTPAGLRTCDIVMKGGITSGVVYPQAITRLAERYQFKNIGGTSAGAIAAAIAAAAEYRRQQSIKADPHGALDNGGFARLDELPKILGQKPGNGERTRLFYFFQPNTRTRRLFDVLTTMLGGGAEAMKATVRRAMEEYASWTRFGMLPGLILILASLVWGSGGIVVAWVLVGALIAAVGAVVAAVIGFVLEFMRELPANGYGLCSGVVESPKFGEPSPPGGAEPLSVWLNNYLNETAGLPPRSGPLTFSQLWGTSQSDPDAEPQRMVNLEMMTTNITHGRPYRLPFRDDPSLRESHRFYFRRSEFLRYFPKEVVEWMVAHPRPVNEHQTEDRKNKQLARRKWLADHDYYPMPGPGDLPVVVATRMSLSFPVLLCAVPLHAYHDRRAKAAVENEDKLEAEENDGDTCQMPSRCWFSDGGITSNFPLHFFDTALPKRPTFSIDLIDEPAGTPAEDMKPRMDEDNYLKSDRWNEFDIADPQSGNTTPKSDLDRFLGFFGAIITTMQNWTDATQAGLPGYRDRIVSVPLTPNEGGLNLDMPDTLIKTLSDRGGEAAAELIKHFYVPSGHQVMTWENHRWIRLRSLHGALVKTLRDIVEANRSPESGDVPYDLWLEHLETTWGKDPQDPQGELPSYIFRGKHRREQLTAIKDTLRALQSIPGLWVEDFPPSHSAPRPRPVLRPRAQI